MYHKFKRTFRFEWDDPPLETTLQIIKKNIFAPEVQTALNLAPVHFMHKNY